MYKCPLCSADSFTFWQKQWLGPARSIKCRACGGAVSVPWLGAVVAIVPIAVLASAGTIVGATLAGNAGFAVGGVLGILLGFAISSPLYHRYVPLVARKP